MLDRTYYLRIICLCAAILELPVFFIALIYQELPVTEFIIFFVFLFFAGVFSIPTKKKRKLQSGVNIPSAMSLIALSFCLLSFVNAISYIPHVLSTEPHEIIIDSVFESVSGYTTTGFSVIDYPELLPTHILFKRAFSQWVGGLGIIVFMIALFSFYKGSHTIRKEMGNNSLLLKLQGYQDRIQPSIKKSLTAVIRMYLVYTLIGFCAFWISGMTLLDSLLFTFTALSTGGFSSWNAFAPTLAQTIIFMCLMIIGALSFAIHSGFFRLDMKAVMRNKEFQMFCFTFLFFCIMHYILYPDVLLVFFQTVSALTGTGFTLIDIMSLPNAFVLSSIFLMTLGGCYSSTTGGIKQFRWFILFKTFFWKLRNMITPDRAIIPFQLNKQTFSMKSILFIHSYVMTYFFVIGVGFFLLSLSGLEGLDALFQSVSALGTVGLRTLTTSLLSPFAKCVTILLMLLGRVEIFPLLVLLRRR